MVYLLVLLIVFPNGTFKKAEQLQPSAQVCAQRALDFITREVEGAQLLSASCMAIDTTKAS